ncbi:MAG: hypothetical protein WBZ36_10160 [Candidatus Nitrosopolaris sp.]
MAKSEINKEAIDQKRTELEKVKIDVVLAVVYILTPKYRYSLYEVSLTRL